MELGREGSLNKMANVHAVFLLCLSCNVELKEKTKINLPS